MYIVYFNTQSGYAVHIWEDMYKLQDTRNTVKKLIETP